MYTTDVLKKRMTDGAYDAELSKLIMNVNNVCMMMALSSQGIENAL